MKEKKDIFNGNIKHQYVSYILASLIIELIVFWGSGGLFFYISFSNHVADRATAILVFCFGIAAVLFGFWCVLGGLFVARSYPKHKKYRKWFFNSDCYFVDSESKEFNGHWRSKSSFNMVASIANQNEAYVGIKYPKKYYVYIWATVISIILMFVNLIFTKICMNHIENLPQYSQNGELVFLLFMFLEVVIMILSFVFAFRVKKTREVTRKEYLQNKKANLQ